MRRLKGQVTDRRTENANFEMVLKREEHLKRERKLMEERAL